MIPPYGRQHRPVSHAATWYRLPGRTGDGLCVDLDRSVIGLRCGRWRLAAQLDNIASVQVGGPYRAGRPMRRSRAEHGLIVATAHARGACLRFRRPVWAIHRTGLRRRARVVCVTVTAPEELVAELRRYLSSTSSSRYPSSTTRCRP